MFKLALIFTYCLTNPLFKASLFIMKNFKLTVFKFGFYKQSKMRDLGIENGQISANRTKPVEFFDFPAC